MKYTIGFLLAILLLSGLLMAVMPHYVTDIPVHFLWTTVTGALLLAAFLLLRHARQRDKQPAAEPDTMQAAGGKPTLDDFIATYGQPEDLILVDPTRGNEADGAILVYHREGSVSLVYDGMRLGREQIADITLNNASTPYTVNDYQIVMSVKDDARPALYIHTGTDASWAHEVLSQVKHHMNLS